MVQGLADLASACAQVLFCTLTNEQRNLYRSYLASAEVADILAVRVVS